MELKRKRAGMDKRQISQLIKELEAERDNLDKAIEYLSTRFVNGSTRDLVALATSKVGGKKRGRPAQLQTKAGAAKASSTKKAKRKISEEARKKMSDAAKRRHAARRKAANG